MQWAKYHQDLPASQGKALQTALFLKSDHFYFQ